MKLELVEKCSSCSNEIHVEFDTTKWLSKQWTWLQDTTFRRKSLLCTSCAELWGGDDYKSEFEQDLNFKAGFRSMRPLDAAAKQALEQETYTHNELVRRNAEALMKKLKKCSSFRQLYLKVMETYGSGSHGTKALDV